MIRDTKNKSEIFINTLEDKLKLMKLLFSRTKRITKNVSEYLDHCSQNNLTLRQTKAFLRQKLKLKTIRRVSYFIKLGYTPVEAEIELKILQDNSKNINYKERITITNLQWYINQGFTLRESKKMLSTRQRKLSSKEAVIKRHDEDYYSNIQQKKRNTFYSKSDDKRTKINFSRTRVNGCYYRKKFFSENPQKRDEEGILYYFQYTVNDKDYWKVGITSRKFNQRFSQTLINRYNIRNVLIEKDTIYKCFLKEQEILNEYNNFRQATPLTTESFIKDINENKKFI